jgi:lipopolysaccharide export LptBFGC system permease protein LptF
MADDSAYPSTRGLLTLIAVILTLILIQLTFLSQGLVGDPIAPILVLVAFAILIGLLGLVTYRRFRG